MSGIADDVDVEEEDEDELVDAVDVAAMTHGLSNERVPSSLDVLADGPTAAAPVVELTGRPLITVRARAGKAQLKWLCEQREAARCRCKKKKNAASQTACTTSGLRRPQHVIVPFPILECIQEGLWALFNAPHLEAAVMNASRANGHPSVQWKDEVKRVASL